SLLPLLSLEHCDVRQCPGSGALFVSRAYQARLKSMLPFTDTQLIRSAFVLAPNHTTAIPVEVRTLSVGHALIIANEPLEGERMLLKLDTARDGEFLLECDVPHRSEYHRVGWSVGEDTYSA